MTHRAIQTIYRGYRFRSRLEARWAVFFETLGLKWEYEPEGFELGDGFRYLPDFRVTYPGRNRSEQHTHWFEVKGDLTQISQSEWEKLVRFSEREDLVLLDGVPTQRMYPQVRSVLLPRVNAFEDPPERPYAIDVEMTKEKRDGWALWSHKGRLWWDYHENFFDYGDDDHIRAIGRACDAARGARFEFGEPRK